MLSMKRVLIVALLIISSIFPVFAEESDVLVKETYKLQGQIEYDDNPVETIYLDEYTKALIDPTSWGLEYHLKYK